MGSPGEELAEQYRERHSSRGIFPPSARGNHAMLVGQGGTWDDAAKNAKLYRAFYSTFGACLDLNWVRDDLFRYTISSPCCGAVLEIVEGEPFDIHGYGTVVGQDCLFCSRFYPGAEPEQEFDTLEATEEELRQLIARFSPALDPLETTILLQDYYRAIGEALARPTDESQVIILGTHHG